MLPGRLTHGITVQLQLHSTFQEGWQDPSVPSLSVYDVPPTKPGCPPPQVNTSIEDWKTTKWKDINVEQMDIDCKKFAKDVRSLDKEMKTWDAFVGLDNTVKNMLTSLRAVSELQNPAIRERHWQQLMQATQVGSACHWARAGRGHGSWVQPDPLGLMLIRANSRGLSLEHKHRHTHTWSESLMPPC